MKILVLQDRLRSGGTERQAIALARGFRQAGHECTLVAFRPGGELTAAAADLKPRTLQGFDSGIDFWAPGLGRLVAGETPQAILCMGRSANGLAGGLQRRFPQTAVVATVRSGYPLPSRYARSIREARAIVTNSAEGAERLATRFRFDPGRVTAIHNALVFPPAEGGRNYALREELGARATLLLDVAMFRPEKNQAALIEAVAGLPPDFDWRLILAGDGPCRGACERLARRRGLGDRVRFTGFCADPGPLYRAADLAVHASREESLCNFIIEAQAHGLPAVAFEALGMRECVVPGFTGWIYPQGDAEGLRAAILRVARASAAERLKMTNDARAFARSNFDPARQTEAYLALFRKLILAASGRR